jgi:hypothetical protein
VTTEANPAIVGINHAHTHAKTGGFTGTIGAEQANEFTFAHFQGHPIDHLAPFVRLGQSLH